MRRPGADRVDLYDAMPSVGRKFLLAGKGGLNLTHSRAARACSCRATARARERDRAAAGATSAPDALRAWAHGLGIETFVGISGRVFPADMKAAPLLRAWLHAAARRRRALPRAPPLARLERRRRAALRHAARRAHGARRRRRAGAGRRQLAAARLRRRVGAAAGGARRRRRAAAARQLRLRRRLERTLPRRASPAQPVKTGGRIVHGRAKAARTASRASSSSRTPASRAA